MPLKDIIVSAAVAIPRILIYGTSGIGKTTWASTMPNPIFFCIEKGLGKLKDIQFWNIESYQDLIDKLNELLNNDHDRKTLVIDSLDWAEKLVHKQVCKENGYKTIDWQQYGQKWKEVMVKVEEVIVLLERLRDEKKMIICLIAHSEVTKFEALQVDSFNKFDLKLLGKEAAARFTEWVDCIFFANYKLGTVKTKGDKGQTVTKTVDTGRALFTTETPMWKAKNRYDLPSELPLDSWQTVREEMVKDAN